MEEPKVTDCPLYYFVPWPQCQKFDELDSRGKHTVASSYGTFVEKNWAEKVDKK